MRRQHRLRPGITDITLGAVVFWNYNDVGGFMVRQETPTLDYIRRAARELNVESGNISRSTATVEIAHYEAIAAKNSAEDEQKQLERDQRSERMDHYEAVRIRNPKQVPLRAMNNELLECELEWHRFRGLEQGHTNLSGEPCFIPTIKSHLKNKTDQVQRLRLCIAELNRLATLGRVEIRPDPDPKQSDCEEFEM
ncbi:hypothetical protein BKA62DRAFT_621989 [Auriculariales sp. MPI-PUGE-AT-0066]|nr:hypothetical protein BKA62DRAFT_621989 [Auriculariales sp. MPI-PUGE-AT-0066]